MKAEFFIANRLAFSKDKTFTKTIIRIAIVAIALSITVMILTNAMISGFKKEIHSKMFGFWGHIHITDSGITKSFDAKPISKNDPFVDKIRKIKSVSYQIEKRDFFGQTIPDEYDVYKTLGGVDKVQSFLFMPGLLEKGKEFQTIVFKGIDNDFDWQGMERFLIYGHQVQKELGKDDIVVSKYLANKLEIQVNQSVIVSFIENKSKIRRKLKVVGIYNTGLEEFDRRFIFGSADKIRPILNWDDDQVAGFEIFVDNIDDNQIINDYIYSEILPSQFYSETIQQKHPSIFEWLKLQDINETIILQLMNVVAIINMMTVLLILILERTKMIGTLKAVGATNWFVQKIFIFNAGFIIFFGILIGNVVGLFLAFLQKKFKFIKLDEANYYLDTAPINIEWSSIFFINILAFCVVLTFLLIPTFFINKIKPVQALRFD
jgi:lipoprotein-releasing system permease protein